MHFALLRTNLESDETTWQRVKDGSNTVIKWFEAEFDNINAFDPSEPSKLFVSWRKAKARLTASVAFKICDEAPYLQIWSRKNGGEIDDELKSHSYFGYMSSSISSGLTFGSSPAINVSGPWIDVAEGDYFELMAYQRGGLGDV